ncbi:glyoxylase-like metal-dependent hydrolase (beta-lactamase superfamily II) [Bacillus oleivorans]|uniref:Glyoxylase-like metal-dependent hydrolase (Beta-lactamase superfamily II) n=1 Tax=Bacillus oleivorans TaxID=1448271 RepID=A0A285CLQ6_9BACI|nr:MBL fold metallo-hydrolase [Bacillus oleivorans]SNX67933.1 glyoxylase-like metal-dependent hydrolase (beta-lactamase superfamily II) [Bacillus oleivorans]
MKWKRTPVGPVAANCYLVWNESKNCLIIDPGGEDEKIRAAIKKLNLSPRAILLTHCHFDHIAALEEIRQSYSIPVYVHENEAKWLLDPALNGSQLFNLGTVRCKPADRFFTTEGTLDVEGFQFTLFETPGHSPGSVSFYFEDDCFVISGDALFYGSIGRTDLPGGNHKELIKSIKEKLLTLPDDTIVLPGHDQETTINQEKEHNPFLK